ncbi:NAD-dependent epimerase/dehydratase family protein [Mucilaginibacter calamicampi]|uniref:NAD-dependent epimerase/dehydratase family protein n=1 Tax=Mucilaginibacter calamicampi TaxID=1302352 RepID=A0ABW2Z0A2_9SPHI
MAKTAIIIGASGLIGSKLLNLLLESRAYDSVISLARKRVQNKHPQLVQELVNFNQPETYLPFIKGDVIFCCLGTTQKQTPNKDDYYKIDHDYPVDLAHAALNNGVNDFHFISAVGADPFSSNFYLRTKGEAERDLKKVGLPTLHIYEPSLLTGRKRKKRLGERIATIVMTIINPLLMGGLKKYQSIDGAIVAKAMFNQSLKNKQGVFIYTTDRIKKRA